MPFTPMMSKEELKELQHRALEETGSFDLKKVKVKGDFLLFVQGGQV